MMICQYSEVISGIQIKTCQKRSNPSVLAKIPKLEAQKENEMETVQKSGQRGDVDQSF